MALTVGQLLENAEKRALSAAFGASVAAFATVGGFLALLTSSVVAATDLTMAAETEYAVTGYARQGWGTTITPSSASPSVVSNAAAITFGPLTGANGTVTFGGAGNPVPAVLGELVSGATNIHIAFGVSAGRTPNASDSLQIAIGGFTAQV